VASTALPVYPIEGTISFAIIEDTVTVIDAGIPTPSLGLHTPRAPSPALQPYFAFFASHNITVTDVQLVVLTGTGWAHMCALGDLVRMTGARVVVHEAAAATVSGQERHPVADRLEEAGVSLRPVPVARTVRDGDRLSFLGGSHVIEMPGHGPGAICIHSPSTRSLCVGDALRIAEGGGLLSPVTCPNPAARRLRQAFAKRLDDLRRLAALDVRCLFAAYSDIEGGPRVLEGDIRGKIQSHLQEFDRMLEQDS